MADSDFAVRIAIDKDSHINNPIYQSLSNLAVVEIESETDSAKLDALFRKGSLAARIKINELSRTEAPYYSIDFESCNAAGTDVQVAKTILKGVVDTLNKLQFVENQNVAVINQAEPIEGRRYTYLDFFLPGMLGFSLLSAGIFGTAFLFFNLRQTLVLKRFFATPVRRINIIAAEGSSRLILQTISAAIIILVGHFAFGFTLVNGLSTFLQMLLLSIFGLIIFLGMGFVISSVAKSEATIPPLANLITMPQLILSGVFISTSKFPDWLQPLCNALPLTQLNNGMRAIAFQGKSLLDLSIPLGILAIWGVVIYVLAVKVFRWD